MAHTDNCDCGRIKVEIDPMCRICAQQSTWAFRDEMVKDIYLDHTDISRRNYPKVA